MFTRTRKNLGNKEYASLFMKVHGVHKVGWQGSLSLVFVINNEIHLNQGLREFVREFVRNVLHIPSLVEEEEGAEGTQRWFG